MNAYLAALKKLSAAKPAAEHSLGSSLEALINAVDKRFTAVDDSRRRACGAPGCVVLDNASGAALTVGYIEARGVGASLDAVQKTGRFRRYAAALDNLVLTNHVEFRRFARGEPRAVLTLGRRTKGGRLEIFSGNEEALRDFLRDFLHVPVTPVTSAQELAARMAGLTRAIRDTVLAALDSPHKANLETWRKAFAGTLLPDLTRNERKADFADMYAQTIAYGFFAARCRHGIGRREFKRENVREGIPGTNPLLHGLFVSLSGPDLREEPHHQFVEDLIQLLALADMKSVLRDFGGRDRRADPVIHFYETFLAAYDPKLRDARGVYYTPEPVVSWLVRSADAVVRTVFAIPQGLAASGRKRKINGAEREIPRVLILDPACGTGTCLCETIDLIRSRLKERGRSGVWPAFVKENLLPRIFGFELLMAPYAVAHFTLGMRLAGHDAPGAERPPRACDFSASERLGVYLANILDGGERADGPPLPDPMKALPGEGLAARRDKHGPPVLVIMGNPPYAGHSANARQRKAGGKKELTFIGRLIEDYRRVDGQPLNEANPKWLQDDYVKFIRWAQWRLDNVDEGVVAFVTNHGYLDNPTFRGMRRSLLRSFDEIYVHDLHGNARKKEKSPDGSPDQNVFDIQQGVALSVFVKRKNGDRQAPARVFHAEMRGERQAKYDHLSASDILSVDWKELRPAAPAFLFVPLDGDLLAEYREGRPVTEMFPAYSVGMATARDKLAVRFTPEELWSAVNEFAAMTPDEARAAFALGEDSGDWRVALAQSDVKQSGPDRRHIRKVLYRPFDLRHTYYTGRSGGFICRPRANIMGRMTGDNIGLVVGRSGAAASIETWETVFVSRHPIDLNVFRRGGGTLFPLHAGGDESDGRPEAEATGAAGGADEAGDKRRLLHYTYALLHSAAYRGRYHEFLQKDFPRVPVTRDAAAFRRLAELGEELAAFHTLEHPALFDAGRLFAGYPVAGAAGRDDRVEKGWPKYDGRGKVFINAGQYFSDVPAEAWGYTIGGYRVAERWLKERRGRRLCPDDILAYRQIILALAETIRLRREIDAAMPAFPWPKG